MKARRVRGLAEMDKEEKPGDYDVVFAHEGRAFFWFVCPGPCKMLSAICLVKGPPNKTWQWDGNIESPTLTPSINHEGCWHGWLRAGEFTPC